MMFLTFKSAKFFENVEIFPDFVSENVELHESFDGWVVSKIWSHDYGVRLKAHSVESEEYSILVPWSNISYAVWEE